MRKKIKGDISLIILMNCLYPMTCLADMQAEYKEAQAYISDKKLTEKLKLSVNESQLAVSNAENLDQNTPPVQSKYYAHPEQLAGAAATKMNEVSESNSSVQTVINGAKERGPVALNEQASVIKDARQIQANADAIAQGTYSDCSKKSIKKRRYVTKHCKTETIFPEKTLSCVKQLSVTIKEEVQPVTQIINLSGVISQSAKITLPTLEGRITDISLELIPRENPWACLIQQNATINGVYVGSDQCHKSARSLKFNRHELNLLFNQGHVNVAIQNYTVSYVYSGTVTIQYKTRKKIPIKQWSSSCVTLPTSCSLVSHQCLSKSVKREGEEKGETREIDGISIHEPCWKTQDVYHCGKPLSVGCAALIDEGCMQTNSQCIASQGEGTDSLCSLFDITLECPFDEVQGEALSCGDKIYCIDGSCQETNTEVNQDFGKSATELTAVGKTGEGIQTQHLSLDSSTEFVRVFTGKQAECSKDAAGVDCCADTGWGNNLLGSCSDQEKELGKAKSRGVVIAAGGYCKHKVAGICVDWRNRYCIFPSKLSYDIQKDGRAGQLHRDFGSGKNTDCSGLTVTEIQHINFSQVDFSNIKDEIVSKGKLPDLKEISKKISAHVQSQSKGEPYLKGGIE